jgi:adenylylsulfate kinase
MERKAKNIFTFHERLIQRSEKEKLLGQKAICVWLTGLSGSGKSTIAQLLEQRLHDLGKLTMLLDGDNIRDGLNRNLGFSDDDRQENIRRIAEVNKLFNSCGVITINAFVSPTIGIRNTAREIIGDCFREVFVDTPLEICEERDVKGLYAKARKGEIKDFTGISSPFESPEQPDLKIKTADHSPEQSTEILFEYIKEKI